MSVKIITKRQIFLAFIVSFFGMILFAGVPVYLFPDTFQTGMFVLAVVVMGALMAIGFAIVYSSPFQKWLIWMSEIKMGRKRLATTRIFLGVLFIIFNLVMINTSQLIGGYTFRNLIGTWVGLVLVLLGLFTRRKVS